MPSEEEDRPVGGAGGRQPPKSAPRPLTSRRFRRTHRS